MRAFTDRDIPIHCKVARGRALRSWTRGSRSPGPNQGLLGKTDPEREDGLLYSLEALGLNLQGTELVALSACETGRGAVDYSEGAFGLVRSLRVAGATSVLMTLYPVNDGEARDFMIAFYKRWLAQRQSDPAAVLAGDQAGLSA